MGGIRKAEGVRSCSGPPPDQAAWSRPDPEAAPHGPRVTVLDTGITAEQRTDGWLVGLATEDERGPARRVRAASGAWTSGPATAPSSPG